MKRVAVLCIGGLLLGLAAGLFLRATTPPWGASLLGVMDAVIRGWTNAFRLIVIPLVITQLYVAIAAGRFTSRDAGRLGIAIPVVFIGLLLTSSFVALGVGRLLLASPLFAGLTLSDPTAVAMPGSAAASAGTAWIDSLVPTNLIGAAASDQIVPLMLFALLFALAARRIAPPLKRTLDDAAHAVRDTFFVVVEWLLLLAPLVTLALGARAAAAHGLRAGGGLLAFVVLTNVLLLVVTGALYPLTALVGRVSLGRFARAAFPAQMAALATRSSLSTVPLLLRATRDTLLLPPVAPAAVLPVAGAMLKLSEAAVNCSRMVFLAHILGVSVGAGDLAIFLVAVLLVSPSTVGLPTVTYPGTTLPAFTAIGIPPAYVVLLGTTTALTDPLETLLNTTSYLSASVLVARFGGSVPETALAVERAAA